LIAGLLGLGSTSLAIALARYRWFFLALSVVSLIERFYLNVLRSSTLPARVVFWAASALTVTTIVRWGWWQL
jgi:hypothetical protein